MPKTHIPLAANSGRCITKAIEDVRTETFRLENIKIMREISPFYIQRALDVIAQLIKKTPQMMNTVLLVEVCSDK